ncbi:hypothetical protein [Flavobacterium piscinae]|nr:hypothetical protein [Flavobacterium piscinae]
MKKYLSTACLVLFFFSCQNKSETTNEEKIDSTATTEKKIVRNV